MFSQKEFTDSMTALVECSSPVQCYFSVVERTDTDLFIGVQYNSALIEETVSKKLKSLDTPKHCDVINERSFRSGP